MGMLARRERLERPDVMKPDTKTFGGVGRIRGQGPKRACLVCNVRVSTTKKFKKIKVQKETDANLFLFRSVCCFINPH